MPAAKAGVGESLLSSGGAAPAPAPIAAVQVAADTGAHERQHYVEAALAFIALAGLVSAPLYTLASVPIWTCASDTGTCELDVPNLRRLGAAAALQLLLLLLLWRGCGWITHASCFPNIVFLVFRVRACAIAVATNF